MARPIPFSRTLRRLAELKARRLPLQLVRLAARLAGRIWCAGDRQGAAAVRANLRHLVPVGEARERAVRQAFVSFAQDLCERPRLADLPTWRLTTPFLTLTDPWQVFAAKPLAGPAILVSAHCHWEHLAVALHQLRLVQGLAAIARRCGDADQDAEDEARLATLGVTTLWLDGAPLAALRRLRERGIVGILADRDYGSHGRRRRFAGGHAILPPGPAALAVQSGAPIIPIFLGRRSADRLHLIVDRPVLPRPGEPRGSETERLGTLISASMTRFLATVPGQWTAFHRAIK